MNMRGMAQNNFMRTTISEDAFQKRMEEKFQRIWGEEVRRKKREQFRRRVAESGLSEAIKTLTFDNFLPSEPWQEEAKRRCRLYADNPVGWLLLSGPPGCGKTHLCTAVVGVLTGRGQEVQYMLYRESMGLLKRQNDDAPAKRMKEYKHADVLYVDDLFKGEVTNADAKLVFELIDFRYRTGKRTIISTEMDDSRLMATDEAIASRIFEKSTKVLIANKEGRNYRL